MELDTQLPALGRNTFTSLAKLKSAPHYVDARLNFLKNYTIDLGADDLISFGAVE